MSSDYSASYTRLSHSTTEEQITTKNYVDQNAKNEEIEKPGSTVMGHSPCPRLVESEETLLYCCSFLFMSKEQQREKVVSSCHCQAIILILKIIGQLIKRKTNKFPKSNNKTTHNFPDDSNRDFGGHIYLQSNERE